MHVQWLELQIIGFKCMLVLQQYSTCCCSIKCELHCLLLTRPNTCQNGNDAGCRDTYKQTGLAPPCDFCLLIADVKQRPQAHPHASTQLLCSLVTALTRTLHHRWGRRQTLRCTPYPMGLDVIWKLLVQSRDWLSTHHLARGTNLLCSKHTKQANIATYI